MQINKLGTQLIEISKEFTIDIAHIVTTQKLPDGMFCKCKQIHGHTVTVKPIIIGTIDTQTRMVLDYTLLSEFKRYLDLYLDHKLVLPKHQKTLGIGIQEVHSVNVDLDFKSSERLLLRRPDGTLLIETLGSISFIDAPSTTAEDMLLLFINMLLISLLVYKDKVDLSNIEYVNIEFRETPKSSCKFYKDIYVKNFFAEWPKMI